MQIKEVKGFWEANPCQGDLSTRKERKRYFDEIEAKRYTHESHIPEVARFESFRGKQVLEVGCGVGTDGIQFARNGAMYSGVDLTAASVALTRERFALDGLKGDIQVANAENGLPFGDATFDHVYSFGVIHHSPNPERIVKEIQRVLKPGGTICVMLYNRTSVNYYVEIMFLRKLFRYLLLPPFMPRLIAKLTGLPEWKLTAHRALALEKRSMSKQEWISRNTDGPGCPLARVYGRREAEDLFKDFEIGEMTICWFDRTHWPIVGKMMPESFARWIAARWGWHRLIYARRPNLPGNIH